MLTKCGMLSGTLCKRIVHRPVLHGVSTSLCTRDFIRDFIQKGDLSKLVKVHRDPEFIKIIVVLCSYLNLEQVMNKCGKNNLYRTAFK